MSLRMCCISMLSFMCFPLQWWCHYICVLFQWYRLRVSPSSIDVITYVLYFEYISNVFPTPVVMSLHECCTILDKKKHHPPDSRREECCSMCGIMLDHSQSVQGKIADSRRSDLALCWSLVIEHDITCGTAFFSLRILGMDLFLARVVVADRIAYSSCIFYRFLVASLSCIL